MLRLNELIRKVTMCLLIVGCCPTLAAERKALDFYGVTPGVTTEKELLQLEDWGRPTNTITRADGARLIRFHIGRWDPIAVTVLDGMVVMIDAAPPRGAEPKKLAKILRLGDVKPLAVGPISSRFGPRYPSAWKSLECSGGLAVMFTAADDGRQVVKVLRFYTHLPTMPAALGMAIRKPTGERARQFQSKDVLEVYSVVPKSAAEQGGVRPGDIVLEFNAKRFGEPREFIKSVQDVPVGSKRKLRVQRKKETLDLEVAVRRRPLNLAYFMRASELFKEKKYDDAIVDLTRTIKLDPASSGAYFNRAATYQRKGEMDRAIADYSEAIRLRPNDPRFRYVRGQMYGRQRRFEEALLDFDEAIRMAPRFGDAYAKRGIAHRQLGHTEQAEADFRKARALTASRAKAAAPRVPARRVSPPPRRDSRILLLDSQLQKQPLAKRNAKIRELRELADASLKKGDLNAAVVSFWSARQLLVERTIPTAAWLRLKIEVTDGEKELERFRDFVGKFNALDYQRHFAGVRVRRVLPGSPSAQAGLLPGERILKIGKQTVSRAEDVAKVLSSVSPKEPTLLVTREAGGKSRLVIVKSRNQE